MMYDEQIVLDLGLNERYVRGQKVPVHNCWHFSTDGNYIDAIFMDEEDFRIGMNRIFVLTAQFGVVILAFALMDTHIHFILYGELSECNRFIHEYVRRTSIHISIRHGEQHKFENVPIHYQPIEDDYYLKVAICYVYKNAPVAGIPFTAYDYPWSSCALLFRRSGYWTFPGWKYDPEGLLDLTKDKRREILGTRSVDFDNVKMTGGLVWPGQYVASEIVERLFRTARSFTYFMGMSKEIDIESRGGYVSLLSIPLQEMRQHKSELCEEMFGIKSIRCLDSGQRLSLARALRARYNSSPKQIARLCGLVYEEVKQLL